MKKIKMLLIICLALVIAVGCGKDDPKKPVDQPSAKQNEEENTNVDYSYGEDIFTSFYEVNEKGIDKNLKNIEFELKTGYDMYTYENKEKYPENEINTYVINRLYRLNGLPNREVRGPVDGGDNYYTIIFFFPKTK